MSSTDPRRHLPAIAKVLSEPRVATLFGLYGRAETTIQARREIDGLRERLESDSDLETALAELPARIRQGLEGRLGRPVRRVLNATGVLLHTNLGRAPLSRRVLADVTPLLGSACDLEIDLETGRRGNRNRRVEGLLTTLTGAEAALVVNNNAAALYLLLRTLAHDSEVIVSRGELVEIGGSFRIPDILREAGAHLVEIGTTNRTRVEDYERAIGPRTGLLLKVHPSNYRQTGFVTSVPASRLAALGRQHDVPVLVDEGAGLLLPDGRPQLGGHESLAELIAAGCDLVCGSGDKLLGGPQAGLVVGRSALVAPCRRHPLYRCLRPGRFPLTALESVLRGVLREEHRPLDGLWQETAVLRPRLEALATAVGGEIVEADAQLGGGAAPEAPILGLAVARPDDGALAAALRAGEPAVVGYVRGGRLMLDLRTVDPQDDEELLDAVRQAVGSLAGRSPEVSTPAPGR